MGQPEPTISNQVKISPMDSKVDVVTGGIITVMCEIKNDSPRPITDIIINLTLFFADGKTLVLSTGPAPLRGIPSGKLTVAPNEQKIGLAKFDTKKVEGGLPPGAYKAEVEAEFVSV